MPKKGLKKSFEFDLPISYYNSVYQKKNISPQILLVDKKDAFTGVSLLFNFAFVFSRGTVG